MANRRSATLELVVGPPARDPEPGRSPWGGFSGAAVWVGERIVGIASENPLRGGLNRLSLTRLDTVLSRVDEARRGRLAEQLGIA